ncbi:GNAT family N-acetyltransferase [Terrilactibacillus laevilacticus]|uniref:GNAT family N-acetyltransferase n=1 Tax=Terrilactibacillus laevilacticus TaxID=1380157 RepID=A0ABW5PM50_9BACI|nr:GNAT family N-acetyltransferase [Terrilactibacillus laevilacticus]
MKIHRKLECEIENNLNENIQELLFECFTNIYPKNRTYFKQLPHFRFLAFNDENDLVGQVGLDYRVMNLDGCPVRILGVIDLCVSPKHQSQEIGSKLLLEIDHFSRERNIDFILLFADNPKLYLKNGYKSVKIKCKWLKIDHENHMTKNIGDEVIDELMIKKTGEMNWSDGDLDLLGYLY